MNKVIHDEKNSRFFVKLSETDPNVEGVLLYEKINNKCLDFYHTEVPKEFRGQGFGALLAGAGIDYIKLNDIKVSLSCTFLSKFGREYLSEEEIRQYVNN